MVKLSKETILEWQKIFEEESGKKVSFTEAEEATNNLISYFDLLSKIHHKNIDSNKIKKYENIAT